MNGLETAQNHVLIQDTYFIKGKILSVLYNTGATHSFISFDYVQYFELSISFLDSSLVVSTSTSKFVSTNKVGLDFPLFIKNIIFLIYLIYLLLS